MIADNPAKKNDPFAPHAREFIADFRRYAGKRGVGALIAVLAGAILEGVGLFLLVPILAVVLDSGANTGWFGVMAARLFAAAGAETRFWRLALLLSIFAALMILRGVVLSVRDVSLARLRIGFIEHQRSTVTLLLANARWDKVVKLRHARISYLMSSDIQSIGLGVIFLLQCAVSLVMLASQCVLAFVLSPKIAAIALVLLAAGCLASGTMLRRARDLGHVVANSNLSLMNSTVQFLGGIKLAVSQNLQARFVEEFHGTLAGLSARQIAYSRMLTNVHLAVITLTALVVAIAVLIGVGIMNIAPSLLIALLFVLGRMNVPLMQIQQGAQQFATSLPAYEKLKELERELTAAAAPRIAASGEADGAVEFRKVGFAYDDGTAILADADVTIVPGSFVGVCGPSGAGKTTFADLLAGLFPPQSGEVLVGGRALRGATLAAWRDRIGYVSQDPFLFHDTVRRNLLWAAPDASESEMWDMLALTGADELVRSMAQGLDTIVGERGILMSGGERQRIALARALLRKPHLLLLDEATNAIDIAGEHAILSRLIALKPRPTIVLIAHRAESTRLCDRILTLADGRFTSAPNLHAVAG